jgi:integrase
MRRSRMRSVKPASRMLVAETFMDTATETKGPRFPTLALAGGADVYWVSRQLGHTDIGTTLKHYARSLPDVQERNLGLLNAYF